MIELKRVGVVMIALWAMTHAASATDLSMTPIYRTRPSVMSSLKTAYPPIKLYDQRYIEPPRQTGAVAGDRGSDAVGVSRVGDR